MEANLIFVFFKSNDSDRLYLKAQTLVIFIFYQFVFQMLWTSTLFREGNGRTARLATNLILERYELVGISIKIEQGNL